jgi:Ca2+-binding EF-hand superfamily protein
VQGKLADPSSYKPEHLNAYLKQLFAIADANGDGVLEPDELRTLLELCGFDLSAKEIEDFVSAADTNHDGVIEYDEFVPVATKMLKSKKGSKVSAAAL